MQRFENLSVKAGFVLLALLAFAIGNFWLLIADRSDREIRLATELGSLGRIDEALTMSALMAAVSDDRYERRYRRLLDERRGVIQRMRQLASDDEMRAMIEAVDRAQRAMIAVEMRSFALNAVGERENSEGLLTELGYRRDLSNYTSALAMVGEKVREDSATATNHAKFWLAAAGGLLLLLGAAMLLREFRLRAQLAKQAIYEAGRRAHRTVMQTVMDAHNNFLNNMVYFRVKAEMSDDFDQEDLRLIDQALDEAKQKLQIIAEMEEAAARGDDLRTLGDGIAVLGAIEAVANKAAGETAASTAEDDAAADGADSETSGDDGGADAWGAGSKQTARKAPGVGFSEDSRLTAPPRAPRSSPGAAKPRTPTRVLTARAARRGITAQKLGDGETSDSESSEPTAST